MPGSRTHKVGENGDAMLRVVGAPEQRRIPWKTWPVYFTDQSPTFQFEVSNFTNEPMVVEFEAYLSYQNQPTTKSKEYRVAVAPYSIEKREFDVDLLAYQGNAIIGLVGDLSNTAWHTRIDKFNSFTDRETMALISDWKWNGIEAIRQIVRVEDDTMTDDNGTDGEIPLYTFLVLDRENYRVNHLWPRRAQYLGAVLSVIIATFAVLSFVLG